MKQRAHSPMSMVSHRLRTDRANRSTSFLYSCKHVTVCEHVFSDARQVTSKVHTTIELVGVT